MSLEQLHPYWQLHAGLANGESLGMTSLLPQDRHTCLLALCLQIE